MRIHYSPTSLEKLQYIRQNIAERFDEDTAVEIMTRITSAIDLLADDPFLGVSASAVFGVDTEYRRLFVAHTHIFYTVGKDFIRIIDVYHEREDILRKLFGISTTEDDEEDF